MKKVKFIFIFFLILLSFIFSGEFFQYYLNTYTSQFSYIDITENERYTQLEIQNNVFQMASRYNVAVLKTEKINNSEKISYIKVYLTDELSDKLKNKFSVMPGLYDSFFSGKTQVEFLNYIDKQVFAKTERYYFIGETHKIQLLRENLTNDYSCSFIKTENEFSYHYLIALVWIVIGILFLILTWLDIHFQKKENFVLISLGKPIYKIIFKNIFIDLFVFSLIFWSVYKVVSKKIYISFEIETVILICLIVLLLNSLLYLTLLKISYKEVLYGANLNEKIISNGYLLKSLSMILTVVVLSCNIVLLSTNFKELKKSERLKSVEEYSFLELIPVSFLDYDENYEEIQSNLTYSIYNELNEKGRIAYSFCALTGANDYCCVNFNSKSLLNDFDCEFEQNDNVDYYVLIPYNFDESHDIDESISVCIEMYFGSSNKFNYKKLTYSKNIELLTYNNADNLALGAENTENPIVIYIDNQSNGIINDKLTVSMLLNKMLFNVSECEVKRLSEKYSLNEKGFYLQQVKISDKISSYQTVLNRALLLNTVISIFLSLLELFIISIIIKLEYKVGTTELAIKKVLGYSLFQKNKQIFLLNTYATMIAVISCTVISLMYKLSLWYVVIAVGISILCFEYIIIVILITRFEKQNVAKILKGGCL